MELVNEEQSTLSFGAVRIGSKHTITVPIINRSKKAATVNFSKCVKSLSKKFVSFVPNGQISMKPKESIDLEITFEPKSRIPQFSEELYIDVEGYQHTLLAINGQGHGIELKLENEIVTFASVVQHGSSSQKVRLMNIGDVATKFKWDESKFAPDFSISPAEGMLFFDSMV